MKIANFKTLILLLLLNISIISVGFILYTNIRQYQLASSANSQSSSYPFAFLSKDVQQKIDVSSKAFIIYDERARAIIASKNAKLRFSPASSAKIMAATIVLENYPLNRVLTAKNMESLGPNNSKMGLVDGEQMTVRNLLYGMMLPSGNDAAYTLAQNFPGGIDAFVSAMNKKANELNATNTHFVDPDGYDDNNYTTAFDLARIAQYAMKNPKFSKIVGTKQKFVADTTGKFVHDLKNLNELLGIDGVTGVKTGFTDEAGGVLVTSVKASDRDYIIVVMNSLDRFADTKNVIEEALQKVKPVTY